MSYATGLRKAIETLRKKILGADAQVELYGRGAGNGVALLFTMTADWFVSPITDVEQGRQQYKWEFCSDDALDALMPFVVETRFRGRKFDVVAWDAPLDAARIYALRTDTVGQEA